MPTPAEGQVQPVAIVTGGSRGIGAVTARRLASQGWDVCITYRSDADAANGVVAECMEAGRSAVAIQADVAAEPDVLRVFAGVDESLGPITTLVNNAGIVAPAARLEEMTAERMDRMLAVNTLGSLLCAREAVRRMSTRHGGAGGQIVNVSSASSRLGSPNQYVDYAASKGAVDSLTIGLAREVADEGIRVNAVRPGIIETEIHASSGDPDRPARLGPSLPMGRAGRAEEVAAAIVWLCSPEASYVTGAILDVAGAR